MGWLFTVFFMLALIAVIEPIRPLNSGSKVFMLSSKRTEVQSNIAFAEIVTGFPSPQGNAHGPSGPTMSTPAPGIMLPSGGGVGVIRRNWAGWREWRRADPTLINSLWRSKMGNGIRKQLGNAEVYIMLALLIGLVTVVIGCWLSDNCWSPEPDQVVTVA